MKTALLLMLVFAAAALAQIPAKSVVNGLAVEVADIQIPVPYGAAETRAMITVCSEQKVTQIQLGTGSQNMTGASDGNAMHYLAPIKAGAAYCASIVGPTERARITQITVTASTYTELYTPPTAHPPATSENTASRQR
jgi:hypothetical protein